MSVMKPSLMTVAILLILVHRTPGGLFRLYYDKSQEYWNPCQLYKGMCRNICEKYEIQYLVCRDDQKCCLKFSLHLVNSNHKKDYNSKSNLSVTSTLSSEI
ncbi:beta-defensin 116 [Choloepus didactylus]|uniref:beta-defensin 116 n=1 Tax=Choloepus didactylus TaxID=27675 RepID=UPI00189E37E5|nr:beta-defensin 116 [Choloepus didactylus]